MTGQISRWLQNHFQSDSRPPIDIVAGCYNAAVRVLTNPDQFPKADFDVLVKLTEEIEADPELIAMVRNYRA